MIPRQTGIEVPTEVARGLFLSGSREPFPDLSLDLDVRMCRKAESWHKPKARERVRLPCDDISFAGADPHEFRALSEAVAARLRAGERVLVRCHWGLERSAVVVALALHALHPSAGLHVVTSHLRMRRSFAVLDPYSVAHGFLESAWG